MSEVKVNKISPRSGTTVTLGDSGDTFTIPSGATINNQGTAVNFGATGSASWVTTVKTGDFTAVAGEGYFVNTTSGEIDVTLPASPSAGDVVAVKDYANTWDSNACILLRNGSNIGGEAINSTLRTEGLAVTLVFVDSTKGWLVTDSGLQEEAPTKQYVVATGGTITCSGNFKIHTFTGPGTFQVTCAGNSGGSNSLDYLVVGGGGGSPQSTPSPDYNYAKGGGGAGGFRESSGAASGCYTASPLGSGVAALTASIASFPIVVGGGGTAGAPGSSVGGDGNPSTFSTITSTGGGKGGSGGAGVGTPSAAAGSAGGSGGGGGAITPLGTAGAGNTPPVSPPQGNNGGAGTSSSATAGGAGGGATAVGTGGVGNPPDDSATGGAGGAGATTSITASPVTYAGGGGGGASYTGTTAPQLPGTVGGAGGSGGGGAGKKNGTANAGTANTGGGAGGTGGSCSPNTGAAGGSGIVVIRYKYQN